MPLLKNNVAFNNPYLRRYPTDARSWQRFIQTLNEQTIDSTAVAGVGSWSMTCVFSASDADTVAWASGTFYEADGTAHSITGDNTGNMTSRTYIYWDSAVSTTAFQTTTTASDAVGSGRILVAVAEDTTTSAFFRTFGGIGGFLVTANEIAANTITANEIAATTITAAELASDSVTAAKIAAGSITTSKLSVGPSVGGALNRDPGFSDMAGWFQGSSFTPDATTVGWSTETVTGAPVGRVAAEITKDGTSQLHSEEIPIDPTKNYRLSVYAIQVSGGRNNYLSVAFLDEDGALINNTSSPTSDATGWSIGTYHYWDIINAQFGASWTRYEITFGPGSGMDATIPTGAVSLRFGGLIPYSTGTANESVVRLQDYRLDEVIPGELIVNGVITGSKINATFDISSKTITADTGTIGGWTLAADSLTSGNFEINADDEQMLIGSATAPTTGTGVFIGKDSSDYEFRVGDPSGAYIHWDGSTLTITYADGIVIDDLRTPYVGDSDSNSIIATQATNKLLTLPTSYATAYDIDPVNIEGSVRLEAEVRATVPNGFFRVLKDSATVVAGPVTITTASFGTSFFTGEFTVVPGSTYEIQGQAASGSVEFNFVNLRARVDAATIAVS